MTAISLAQRSGQGARFQVVPADAALGAEVRGIDLKQLDDATFQALHEAWLHHVLLVFRGQSLAAEDLVVLVRRFGTPVTSSNLHQRNLEGRAANRLYNLPPEVTVVSNIRDRGESIGILGDVVVWDNRATLHRRDAFDSNSRRVLYAAQVEGHQPYEAQDALSLPPHPRARLQGRSGVAAS